MNSLSDSFVVAFGLITSLDAALVEIVARSLTVSLWATLLAFVIGAGAGSLLAIASFRFKPLAIVLLNTYVAIPAVVVGLIVDLSYSNPFLSPFDEFQRYKHHPVIAQYLEGGKRVAYGARAICKGGLNSLPKMVFPGGALIGCDLGTLNFAKIKGSHTAMKSGMLAAESVAEALLGGKEGGDELTNYVDNFKSSWLYEELFCSRNFGAAIHKFGAIVGGAFNFIDQNIFGGKIPVTLRDNKPDYACLKPAAECQKIVYPKPDGKISFDKLSSVFLSNTNHEEEQPCHLKLTDPSIPLSKNLPLYDEPAQRYCPAGVYEVVTQEDGEKRFQINAQNCVHCKTCDIKDPSQNITWVAPEGTGGPNYPNM